MTEVLAYLRARQVAERLGSSERTVRRLIADGTLPSVKIGGARLVADADLKVALSPVTEVGNSVHGDGGAPEEITETYASVVKAHAK